MLGVGACSAMDGNLIRNRRYLNAARFSVIVRSPPPPLHLLPPCLPACLHSCFQACD